MFSQGQTLNPRAIAIRLATVADEPALARLAALDSSPCLGDRALIGELGGAPVAALSLADGKVIADPFVATAELVALLRLRARQLAGGRGRQHGAGRAMRATPRLSLLLPLWRG